MPTKFRIGVIGHTGRGNYGHGIDTVWSQFKDRCEIVAVADADDKGRAEAVKRLEAPRSYADYRQMLDEAKPQIVAICPRWLDQHRDMVVAPAERGMHIYMEKPMCRTLAEADEMVAACEKHGKTAACLAGSVAQGRDWLKRGYRMMSYSGDIWILAEGLSRGIREMKEG